MQTQHFKSLPIKASITVLAFLSLLPAICFSSEDIGLPVLENTPNTAMITENIADNTLASEKSNPAASASENRKLIPLTKECIDKASAGYGVHPDILYAILYVEGGTVGNTNSGNKNGTRDLNLFQMNEVNLPELQREFGITREQVLNDGCLAAALAARHLIKSTAGQPAPKTQMEYLQLLALYHSADPTYNRIYALKLKEAFEYLSRHTN